jgi:hypothetical protein
MAPRAPKNQSIPPELLEAATLTQLIQHRLQRDGLQQVAAAILVSAWLNREGRGEG